jgi:hypothetical protein
MTAPSNQERETERGAKEQVAAGLLTNRINFGLLREQIDQRLQGKR